MGTTTSREECFVVIAPETNPLQPRATMLRKHLQNAHQHTAHARKPVLIM
jgi:hypothetical protein